MPKPNHKLKVTEPKNVFTKPLQADFKGLFLGLAKGIGHTVAGKWEELGADTVEALSAIGLATDPEELAFILIRRSIIKALFELVGESASQQLAEAKGDARAITEQLNFSLSVRHFQIDQRFLDRPADLPVISEIQGLLQKWLQSLKINEQTASSVCERFPSYFVYALNREWRLNAKSYLPLVAALNTPFTKAGDREWAWTTYSAYLQRKIDEGIFDEAFGLRQIYVPLNAYYLEDAPQVDKLARSNQHRRRVVVSLDKELDDWLQNANPQDTIRVLSGGPGSGKSSFARIFAARISQKPRLKLLFAPLHLIDPTKDLSEAVGQFARDEGILVQNPLDPESPEPNLLIIFDGLDELASQGKAAAETARSFLREIEKTLERRNQQGVKLRILISGREVVVQENELEFRRPRQVLTLLPYFVPMIPGDRNDAGQLGRDGEIYSDANKHLEKDLRQVWWRNYGALTGRKYKGLPVELSRDDLAEITAQPLLNYLVALSFTRDKLDFQKDINLNSIYADLLAAVHERGYEKNRTFGPIRHMKLEDFARVLEEIGLAAWHGDGRTTTVKEIEDHCRSSGLGALLKDFKDGAEAGVTRLLAAFFFRQFGQRPSGDPTFVFTHKSFGEYLAVRRIARAVSRMVNAFDNRSKNPDDGWDERDALKHWVSICGPSAISQYLHIFLLNEIKLRPDVEIFHWQKVLARLFGHMISHGMPMEQTQITPFKEALFQSRNSEEALLVALNACARVSQQLSDMRFDKDTDKNPTSVSSWFKRIQGQRTGPESSIASQCFSYADIGSAIFDIGDFYGANFEYSNLENLNAQYTCFETSTLKCTKLGYAIFYESNLEGANLERADLNNADLTGAKLTGANLAEAILTGAVLTGAKLTGANLAEAILTGADLSGADLSGANLVDADLSGANLTEANLTEANLTEANLAEANLAEANLAEANLSEADLTGADLTGACLTEANLKGAKGAYLAEANFKGAKGGERVAQKK